MSKPDYLEVHLKQLYELFPAVSTEEMSEVFFLSKASSGSELKIVDHPFRFDGFFAYYCIRGKFNVEVNMRRHEISEGTLFLYVPGNIINLSDIQDAEKSRFVVAAVSRKIIQDAIVDFSKLHDDAVQMMSNPCINLGREQVDICAGYYRLAEKLMTSTSPRIESALFDLGSSLFQYLGNLWTSHLADDAAHAGNTIRSKATFDRFMKLVSEHHTREREVTFYAEKLNITPKYLSQLVRKTSGQSAPDWISSFVILEAKNYLKYSDMDIKEIAYKLNFSSPPSFFRYFKAHTGMTPQGFRKS